MHLLIGPGQSLPLSCCEMLKWLWKTRCCRKIATFDCCRHGIHVVVGALPINDRRLRLALRGIAEAIECLAGERRSGAHSTLRHTELLQAGLDGLTTGILGSSKDDLSQVQYPRNTYPLLAAGLRTTPGVSL